MSDNLQKRGGQDRRRINLGGLRAARLGLEVWRNRARAEGRGTSGDRAEAVEKRLKSAGNSGSERLGSASERE